MRSELQLRLVMLTEKQVVIRFKLIERFTYLYVH